MRSAYLAFLAIGIAFIAIGYRGQQAFIYVGIAFLVIAFLRWRRALSRH
jgi:hypothetical protein